MRDKILNILSYLAQSVSKNKDLFYDSQEIWDHLTNQGFSEEDIEEILKDAKKDKFFKKYPEAWALRYLRDLSIGFQCLSKMDKDSVERFSKLFLAISRDKSGKLKRRYDRLVAKVLKDM